MLLLSGSAGKAGMAQVLHAIGLTILHVFQSIDKFFFELISKYPRIVTTVLELILLVIVVIAVVRWIKPKMAESKLFTVILWAVVILVVILIILSLI